MRKNEELTVKQLRDRLKNARLKLKNEVRNGRPSSLKRLIYDFFGDNSDEMKEFNEIEDCPAQVGSSTPIFSSFEKPSNTVSYNHPNIDVSGYECFINTLEDKTDGYDYWAHHHRKSWFSKLKEDYPTIDQFLRGILPILKKPISRVIEILFIVLLLRMLVI